jgi:hypothetical protein
MKKPKIILLMLLAAGIAHGQFPPPPGNELQGGLGMTWIDNQPYYTFHLRPEFSFGKIGVGLDLVLDFDAHGKLRKENFNEFSDYASVVRYVRYGMERDPLFIKLGALDYVTLGHGSIINTYNNSPSYDARHIGLQLSMNEGKYGFESMYGNFGQAGVVGIRGYVHPLLFTSVADLPIVGNMEIGATYAGDFDRYARIDAIQNLNPLDVTVGSSLNVVGVDIALPIVSGDKGEIDLFADYSKILDFGSGTAVGVIFNLNATVLFSIRSKLERQFNGANYLPSYFNAFYEIERFNTITGSSKSYTLRSLNTNSNGYYGDLLIRVVNTFAIIGSYQKLDNFDSSGIVHIATDLSPENSPVVLRAGYDKINIASWQDLITTDDRSYLYAEIGYRPVPYIIVSTRYLWTFTPVRDAGNHVIGYEPQKRIEPRITFACPLP